MYLIVTQGDIILGIKINFKDLLNQKYLRT